LRFGVVFLFPCATIAVPGLLPGSLNALEQKRKKSHYYPIKNKFWQQVAEGK
jgi:hypothetical protein